MADYAPALERARRQAAGRAMSLERPPSALPGVRYGAIARPWRRARLVPRAVAGRRVRRSTGDAGADPREPTFVQANLSTSAPGVLRGLHLHRRQLDYWVVAGGPRVRRARRRAAGRSTGGRQPVVETRELGADDWVVIPTGVAHGFLALEPLQLLYLVTNEYDGTDELGFAWDDPAVGVPWPRRGRDRRTDGRSCPSAIAPNPTLAELVVRLRHGD